MRSDPRLSALPLLQAVRPTTAVRYRGSGRCPARRRDDGPARHHVPKPQPAETFGKPLRYLYDEQRPAKPVAALREPAARRAADPIKRGYLSRTHHVAEAPGAPLFPAAGDAPIRRQAATEPRRPR